MIKQAAAILEDCYTRYHKPELIEPDPLMFPRLFTDSRDIEIAAFIAASFALGRVGLILAFLERVFNTLGTPYEGLAGRSEDELTNLFAGFKYRFYASGDIIHFMKGVRLVCLEYETLENCFTEGYRKAGGCGLPDDPVLAGLSFLADSVNRGGSKRNIVSNPRGGSACKRLFLFLRWVVRCDSIDPGGWLLSPSKLVIPLDTHVMRVSRYLGLTERKSADYKTALEITGQLKLFDKEDPVKYDFSMSRIGIHPDLSYAELENYKEL